MMCSISKINEYIPISSSLDDIGIIVTDTSGSILYVNQFFTRLSGYTFEEVLNKKIGKSSGILYSGLHDDYFYHNLWTTILSGKVYSGDIINKGRDTKLYYQHVTILPFKENGEVTNFVTFITNKTKEVEIQEQLKKMNSEFIKFLNAIRSAFVIFKIHKDDNGIPYTYSFEQVNPYFDDIMPIRGREVIGKTIEEVFGVVDKVWYDNTFDVLRTGKQKTFQEYFSATGKFYTCTFYKLDEDRVVSIFSDTTEERENYLKLKTYIEVSTDIIIILKKDLSIYTVLPEKNLVGTYSCFSKSQDKSIYDISFFSTIIEDLIEQLTKIIKRPDKKITREYEISGRYYEFIISKYNSNKFYFNIRDITDSRKLVEQQYGLNILKQEIDRLTKSSENYTPED